MMQITNENDGCEKRKRNRVNFKNRKIFQPATSVDGYFHVPAPVFSPDCTINMRKINSADHRLQSWKPVSSRGELFSKQVNLSSVR